jgi:hypothetical protein
VYFAVVDTMGENAYAQMRFLSAFLKSAAQA